MRQPAGAAPWRDLHMAPRSVLDCPSAPNNEQDVIATRAVCAIAQVPSAVKAQRKFLAQLRKHAPAAAAAAAAGSGSPGAACAAHVDGIANRTAPAAMLQQLAELQQLLQQPGACKGAAVKGRACSGRAGRTGSSPGSPSAPPAQQDQQRESLGSRLGAMSRVSSSLSQMLSLVTSSEAGDECAADA